MSLILHSTDCLRPLLYILRILGRTYCGKHFFDFNISSSAGYYLVMKLRVQDIGSSVVNLPRLGGSTEVGGCQAESLHQQPAGGPWGQQSMMTENWFKRLLKLS